jgi:hypothetical protein
VAGVIPHWTNRNIALTGFRHVTFEVWMRKRWREELSSTIRCWRKPLSRDEDQYFLGTLFWCMISQSPEYRMASVLRFNVRYNELVPEAFHGQILVTLPKTFRFAYSRGTTSKWLELHTALVQVSVPLQTALTCPWDKTNPLTMDPSDLYCNKATHQNGCHLDRRWIFRSQRFSSYVTRKIIFSRFWRYNTGVLSQDACRALANVLINLIFPFLIFDSVVSTFDSSNGSAVIAVLVTGAAYQVKSLVPSLIL